LTEPDSVNELYQAIDYYEAKLIVFDNLGTISGGTDETSSQMIPVMGSLRKIAETTQSALIVIHHTSKAGSLRGHSSINAAVDLALLIERNSDEVVMKSTKTRHAPISPFSAIWSYESENRELVKGRFFGLGQVKTDSTNKEQMAERLIMEYLDDGMNQSEIIEKLKGRVGRDAILKSLENLVSSEKLVIKTGPKNSKLYSRTQFSSYSI
jgi:hypothetical protein